MEVSNQADTSNTPANAPDAAQASPAPEGSNTPSGGEGGTPAVGADGKVDLSSLLGEEYAGNKSFEQFKDSGVQGLAKSYLDQQKYIGELNTKVENFKIPENVADYGFTKPDNLPEGMEYSEEHAAAWAQKFQEAGVPPKMAQAIRNQFMEEMVALHQQQSGDSAEANARLDEQYTQHFGDNKLAAVERVKGVMEKVFPDEGTRADLMKTLPDEALLAIGVIEKHYRETYGQEDSNFGDEGGQDSAKNVNELRKEAQELMASKEYRDGMNPKSKEVREKVKNLYATIDELTKAQQKK